jgi:AcrR family transcriptional regulator
MTNRTYRSERRETAAAETRARILAAAREMLADASQASLSMEAVAKRAGVTRLTVYNQFATKQGLLDAAFDEIAREGGLFELRDVMEQKDPLVAFSRLVEIFCRFWHNHGTAMPKLAQMAGDAEVATTLTERHARRRHLLAALLGRMQKPPSGDLVDTLFALTSFEFYRQLDRAGRTAQQIEALIHELVETSLTRAGVPRRRPSPERRGKDR